MDKLLPMSLWEASVVVVDSLSEEYWLRSRGHERQGDCKISIITGDGLILVTEVACGCIIVSLNVDVESVVCADFERLRDFDSVLTVVPPLNGQSIFCRLCVSYQFFVSNHEGLTYHKGKNVLSRLSC